jgi:hypothetical protein
MTEHGKNQQKPAKPLTTKQRRALEALLVAPSIAAAASQAGCGERSLRGWLKDDEGFKAAFLEARRQVMDTLFWICRRPTVRQRRY